MVDHDESGVDLVVDHDESGVDLVVRLSVYPPILMLY